MSLVGQSVHFKGEVIVSRNRIAPPPLDQTDRAATSSGGAVPKNKASEEQAYSIVVRSIQKLLRGYALL